jgi:hypothetical protein
MLLVAGFLLGLTGCGGAWETDATLTQQPRRCVDDSPACIAERQAQLRTLLADRERKWVRDPASPDAYAAGVRLFAFKSQKKALSCHELAAGRREADAGPAVLRGPTGRHLTPAQISRGAMLATEVSRELGGEMRRRCPA